MRMTDNRLGSKAEILSIRLNRRFRIESVSVGLRSFVDVTDGHSTVFTDSPGRLWEKLDAYERGAEAMLRRLQQEAVPALTR